MTFVNPYETIPWLRGASRWPLISVKYLIEQKITDGPHETPDFLDDGYPFLSVDGIQEGELTFKGCRFISEDQHKEFRRKAAPMRGDVLFGKAASTGKIARVKTDTEFSIWSPLALLRSSQTKITSAYLEYALKSEIAQAQVFVLMTTNTQNNISMDAIPRIRIPVPPLPVQIQIADYLNKEVIRINSLISVKERMINLLAEKRLALINHAVTRGLNFDAPLCDSGIPWLSKIPAHWKKERARWLFCERDQRSEMGKEELLTVSHLTGVTPRSEKDVNMFEAETKEGYKICLEGDLVINTLWAWMGAMGISPVNGIVSPAYNVYQPEARLLPGYVDFLVRLPIFAQEVIRHSKGVWSSRLRLYPEYFFEIFLPVPPIREQKEIVSYLEKKTGKINKLRAATERTIALLKERRAALIAAAVTGQIDIGEVAA